MTLSERLTHLTPGGDDGWGLFRRARDLKRAGRPIIELTIGEHDIRTHPRILDAMHAAALAGHTGYADVPGIPALRQAVADRVTAQSGVPTGPENVQITAGGQAALFAAHMAVADPGATALYVDPYYATYPGTVRGAGLVPQTIPARPEDGFQPDLAALADAAPAARSFLINTPNNPTGVIYSRATLEGIAEIARANDLWLISDEVYDSQVWEGEHLSPRALPGMAERTLVVGSLSKSHAMTGSRLGWLVGPAAVIDALSNLATHTTYGIPGFIQDAGLFALRLGPEFEAEVAAPFARRRALTEAALAGQQVVRAAPMQGGMYAMLDIRPTGLSGTAFAESLLDATGVAVMPGESFGTAAAGHVRVAMTVADEDYADALDRLLDHAATLAGLPLNRSA